MNLFPDHIRIYRATGSSNPVTGAFSETSNTLLYDAACDAQTEKETSAFTEGSSPPVTIESRVRFRVFLKSSRGFQMTARDARILTDLLKAGDSVKLTLDGESADRFGEVLEIDSTDASVLVVV